MIQELKQTIRDKDDIIKEKDERLERMMMKTNTTIENVATTASRSIATINTGGGNINVQNNVTIQQPLTEQFVIEQSKNMQKYDVRSAESLGLFLGNNIMKHTSVITDRSRSKITYMNENGETVKDNVERILPKVLNPIAPKISEFSMDLQNEYFELYKEDLDSIFLQKIERSKNVNMIIKGIVDSKELGDETSKIKKELLSVICSTIDGDKKVVMTKDQVKQIKNNLPDIEITIPDKKVEEIFEEDDDWEGSVENSENNETEDEESNDEDQVKEGSINEDEEDSSESRKKYYLHMINKLGERLSEVGQQYKDTDGTVYERAHNKIDNIKRIYIRYGDFYLDEDENVTHPLKFMKADRLVVKNRLKDMETKTLNDLIDEGMAFFPNYEGFSRWNLWLKEGVT
jgi:hypothetical protein